MEAGDARPWLSLHGGASGSASAWSQASAADLPETYGKGPANVLLTGADQWNSPCVGYGALDLAY